MAATEQRAQLRSVGILADLSDVELDKLADELVWSPVQAGEKVLSHLTPSADIYFAIEGAFRAEMTTAFGRTIAFRQMKAGVHFGEIAALTGAPRTLTIVAERDGLVAICPADAFRALMQSDGAFAEKVAISLARTVVLLTDKLFELAALEVRFRLYAELLRLARGGEPTAEGVIIAEPPTQDKLAAAIGAQREAVSRELGYLADEGIVKKGHRELVILNLDRLRDMVQKRAGVTATHVVDWPV